MNLKLIGITLIATIGFSQTRLVPPSPAELWRVIRNMLTSPDGERNFQKIRGSLTPPAHQKFDGTIVSQPSPQELIVNVDDPAGDAMLQFPSALSGAVAGGTPVHFEGVVSSVTKDPYRLTLEVNGKQIEGLPHEAIPER